MALFEGKTPAERNKMIAAIVLPLIALIFVVRMFFGSSGPTPNTNRPANTNRQQRVGNQQRQSPNPIDNTPDAGQDIVSMMTKIVCCDEPSGGADAGRNIFAFYVKPTPTPNAASLAPPPTPTPPPPIVLASLAPQTVFAKTAGFTLQVAGDKFGPADRVYLDGQELPTQYRSVQQLTAQVPASAIAGPGPRQVMVRTPDGKLYSNPQTLNVMQPPAPTYTYVGLLKRARSNTAVLKDSRGELYSVREGDLVEGRFRVTEISERGVDVVDKDLNIKHTIPFVAGAGANAPGRGPVPGSIQPPPPPEGEEEP
jgi:hypothetical protein